MRYLKLYDGFKTPNSEIFETMKDILVDLKDDGYYVSISKDGTDLEKLSFVPSLYGVSITVSTWNGSGMDIQQVMKSIKEFPYDNIKDTFYRLLIYMMSEGYKFEISYSDINVGWRVAEDAITKGIEGEHDYYRIIFE